MSEEIKSKRLLSLDVFRGITIAGMILVNNPGSWEAIYPPLEHAAWNGWTPTDFIFPFFLFIVGISISLALGKRVSDDDKTKIYIKIVRRAAVIFLLGLFPERISVFRFVDVENSRRFAKNRGLLSGRFARFSAYELETADDNRRFTSYNLLDFDDDDSRSGLRNHDG